jgi:hypothetical protein
MADGDGGDRSRRPDATTLSLHGRGVVVRFAFEGSAVFFEGVGASRTGVGSTVPRGCC